MQTETQRRCPSHRGATKRTTLRKYYRIYIKTDCHGEMYYKPLDIIEAVNPPKEEVHLHENQWGDRWEEEIEVYESKREYEENIKILKKNGGKEMR